tara:strand:+ start:103 stop:771 length:669 start_codon:yes stop_codon:yes gene_type:complete
MKVNLRFHKTLLKYTDEVRDVTFDVASYGQLISAIEASFPKLKKIIKQIKNKQITDNFSLVDLEKNRLLTFNDYLSKKIRSTNLCLSPIVAGGKSNLETALVATALIVASFYIPGSKEIAGMAINQMVFTVGFAMLTSAVTAELMKPPKKDGTDEEARENDAFGSLQHTIASGTPIPLVYGRHRVAGQFLSGEIRTLEKPPQRANQPNVMKEIFKSSYESLF